MLELFSPSRTRARRLRLPYQKYERLAQRIGVSALTPLGPFSRDEIIAAIKTDSFLNNLDYYAWEKKHEAVLRMSPADHDRRIAREPGGWSIGHTFCLLKHVAFHHIAKGD